MATHAAVASGRPTILCVDDEPAVLRTLKRSLRMLDANILTTNKTDLAIEAIRRYPVSVIVTDLMMPAMTGGQLLKQAAQIRPDAFHMIITGHANIATISDTLSESRVDHIVQKPWRNAELIQAVQEGLQVAALKVKNARLRLQAKQLYRKLNQDKLVLRTGIEKRTRQLKGLLAQMHERQQQTEEVLLHIIDHHPWLRVRESRRIGHATQNIIEELTKSLHLSDDEQHGIWLAGHLCQIGLLGTTTSYDDLNLKTMSFEARAHFYKQSDMVSDIFSPCPSLTLAATILSQQFEHFNGQGYPGKKARQDIALGARILAVARDYCWLRNGFLNGTVHSHQEAIAVINRHRNIYYDGELVSLLTNLS